MGSPSRIVSSAVPRLLIIIPRYIASLNYGRKLSVSLLLLLIIRIMVPLTAKFAVAAAGEILPEANLAAEIR